MQHREGTVNEHSPCLLLLLGVRLSPLDLLGPEIRNNRFVNDIIYILNWGPPNYDLWAKISPPQVFIRTSDENGTPMGTLM